MMLPADEVASGSVKRAIRFILPNRQIQKAQFLKPAASASAL
jgi:hypothetical protein